MTCLELDERIDDWLDGSLPASEAAGVEAHLAACDGCREGARRLRLVLAHAAAVPRSIAPQRDLWPEVAARISRPHGWSWLFAWGNPTLLAAATLAVVVSGVVVWRQQAKGIVRTVEMPAVGDEGVAVVSTTARAGAVADPVLARAERDYEAASNALLEALQVRRRSLQPETLAAVEANLQVIDRALGEVRLALVTDPHNAELNRMLVATHRKKVDVLRTVVRLSAAL